MTQQIPTQSDNKYDYLRAKYIFRYPFTFTAIKWGLVIGTFFSLHTFVRSRSLRKSFQYFIGSSVLFTFPIWAFFMVKYNFYAGSMQKYEEQNTQQIQHLELYKRYIEYKLKLSSNHDLNEQQLMSEYQHYLKQLLQKNSKLDYLLNNINAETFD